MLNYLYNLYLSNSILLSLNPPKKYINPRVKLNIIWHLIPLFSSFVIFVIHYLACNIIYYFLFYFICTHMWGHQIKYILWITVVQRQLSSLEMGVLLWIHHYNELFYVTLICVTGLLMVLCFLIKFSSIIIAVVSRMKMFWIFRKNIILWKSG